MLIGLADGLIEALPLLIEKAPVIIEKLVNAIVEGVPKLIEASFEIVTKLVSGIVENLPQIGAAAGQIINALIKGCAALVDKIVNIGFDIVKSIWNGITGNGNWLIEKGKEFLTEFGKGVLGEATSTGEKVGIAFSEGVDDGLRKSSGGGFGRTKVNGEWVRKFSGVEDGLFKEVGAEASAEFADGMEENAGAVTEAVEEMTDEAYKKAILAIKDYRNQTDYRIEGEKAMWEELSKHFTELSEKKVEIGNNITRLQKEQLKQQEKDEKEALKTGQDIQKSREKAASDAAKAREKSEKEALQAIEKAEKDFNAQQKLLAEENKKVFTESVKEMVAALKEQYQEASEVEQYELDRQIQSVKDATTEKITEYQREHDEKIKLIDEASQAEIKALQAQLAALDEDSSPDKTYENTKKLIDLNQAIVQARMGNGDLAKALEAYDNEVARQEKEKKDAQIKSEKELLTAQIKGVEEAAKLKIQLMKEEQDYTKAALDEEIAYRQEVAAMEIEISGTKNEQLKQLMQEDLDEFIRVHDEKAAIANNDTSTLKFNQMIDELQNKLGEATSAAEKARLQKQLDELQGFREEFFSKITLSAQQNEALLSQAQEEINHSQLKTLKKQQYAEMSESENLQAEARRQLLQENEEAAISLFSEYNDEWKQQSEKRIESMDEGAKEGVANLTASVNEAAKTLGSIEYTGIAEALKKDISEAQQYIPKYQLLGENFSTAFGNAINKLQSFVSDTISDISETVGSWVAAMAETIRIKNDEIITLLEEYQPKWFAAGEAFVGSLSEGANFQKFIDKAVAAFKKAQELMLGIDEEEEAAAHDPWANYRNMTVAERMQLADSTLKGTSSLVVNINQPVESPAEMTRAIKNAAVEIGAEFA